MGVESKNNGVIMSDLLKKGCFGENSTGWAGKKMMFGRLFLTCNLLILLDLQKKKYFFVDFFQEWDRMVGGWTRKTNKGERK